MNGGDYLGELQHIFQVVRSAEDDETKKKPLRKLVNRAEQELSDLPIWKDTEGRRDPDLLALYKAAGKSCPNWNLGELYGSYGIFALLRAIDSWDDPNAPRWRAAATFLQWKLVGDAHGFSEKIINRMHFACVGYAAHMGQTVRDSQRQKARRSRSNPNVAEILSRLAGYQDCTNGELWPHFVRALDDAELDPEEGNQNKKVNERFVRYYDKSGNRHQITFKTFTNRLGKLRRKLPR